LFKHKANQKIKMKSFARTILFKSFQQKKIQKDD